MKEETAKPDLQMKDVSSSDALHKSYGHDVNKWLDFRLKCRAERRKKKDLLRALKQMKSEHRTFLFSANDENHNQAVVRAGVLKAS
jgi:uncharacterized protein YeaO (DUF488 family)